MRPQLLATALFALGLAFVMEPWEMSDLSDLSQMVSLWGNLTNITERAKTFHTSFDIASAIPSDDDTWRDYRKVEVALLKWHAELYSLQKSLSLEEIDSQHTDLLLAALSRETLRTKKVYDDDDHFYKQRHKKKNHSNKNVHSKRKKPYTSRESKNRYRKKRIESWRIPDDEDDHDDSGYNHRYEDDDDHERDIGDNSWRIEDHEKEGGGHPESLASATSASCSNTTYAELSESMIKWISRILTMYVLTVGLSSASKDNKLVLFTLLFTVCLVPLVWQGKEMNDALSGAVVHLRLRQVQLAGVFPSSSKAEMIAQQLILQKIDVICTYWEKQALGLSFKIPFIDIPISLENEVLGGMFMANAVKVIETFM